MESSPVFIRCPFLVQYMTLTCFCIKTSLRFVQPKNANPEIQSFIEVISVLTISFRDDYVKLRNKKLQKYCSSAQLMFAYSPRNGKIRSAFFFSHNSYSQCFFSHFILFGEVAIFNSVFFKNSKTILIM